MKDIIAYILFYLIWNSPIHQAHPTMIPVMLTLWIIINIAELVSSDKR
jgi:hypothetical protein